MRLILPIFCLFALTASADDFFFAKPGSSEWNSLYDPPYPAPAEIPVGDPLRKSLFDILRPHVAKIAGVPVQFQGSMKSYRNWALFQGETQDKSGTPIAFPELENSDTVALYIRTITGWQLVDFSSGHGDVFYEVWTEQYGMPRKLLGFPE